MSSGSSDRYQSRLFNFVHQQSRRLTQNWENTYRHLQVATKWGIELLLYPMYLLFHSTEASRNTLPAKEAKPTLKLQPNDSNFSADTSIHQVLDTLQHLSSEEATATPSTAFKPLERLGNLWFKFVHHSSTNNPDLTQSLSIPDNSAASLKTSQPQNTLKQHLRVVRGIATNLGNHNLVLVTADNEILDILTPQQQRKLEDRIISEVANYWHSWQLKEARKTELLPEIDRLLAKLTGENPTQISVNSEEIPKDLLKADKLFTFLDVVVAKLESNALVPAQKYSLEIARVAQTQLNIFIYGKEQLAARGDIASSADNLETHVLNFQALIEAALNYFFGVESNKTLPHLPRKSLHTNHQLQNQDLAADSWLKWSDLFGEIKTVTSSSNSDFAVTSNLSLPKNLVIQPEAESSVSQGKKSTSNLVVNHKKTRKIASAKQTRSQSYNGEIQVQQFRKSTEVEAQPDWIETQATLMGYEKHILEQLLEWLDYVLLWLEEIFMNIFMFFKGLLGGKSTNKS